MLVYRSLQQWSRLRRPLVLAAGAFDGVHRGHADVIRRAIRAARARRGEAWVLTFDPHPLRVLHPERAPALLTSRDHKIKLLHDLGVTGCMALPFTPKLAVVEPEDFIARLCRAAPSLRRMVVGANWTFGRRARGNVDLLRALAARHHFEVLIAPPVRWKGAPISSTRIRDRVAEGQLLEAEAMLGRPFSIRGDVVHGRKVGRRLGFPTANVDPHNEVRPPPGVYAARAVVRGRRHPAAVYLTDRSPIVEAHLIGRTLDLYGQEIELEFVGKVSDARRVRSRAALVRKIASDIEAAQRLLARYGGARKPARRKPART